MKKDTIYTFLIILMIGMFSTNFIFFQMNNKTLFGELQLVLLQVVFYLLKTELRKDKIKNKIINSVRPIPDPTNPSHPQTNPRHTICHHICVCFFLNIYLPPNGSPLFFLSFCLIELEN